MTECFVRKFSHPYLPPSIHPYIPPSIPPQDSKHTKIGATKIISIPTWLQDLPNNKKFPSNHSSIYHLPPVSKIGSQDLPPHHPVGIIGTLWPPGEEHVHAMHPLLGTVQTHQSVIRGTAQPRNNYLPIIPVTPLIPPQLPPYFLQHPRLVIHFITGRIQLELLHQDPLLYLWEGGVNITLVVVRCPLFISQNIYDFPSLFSYI